MSSNTSIEWTATVNADGSVATWNPTRGCALVSPGCENCYAMKFAHRFSAEGQRYAGLTVLGNHGPRWTGSARPAPEVLAQPLRWRRPRRIFVDSMSDLFHEDVPDDYIAAVFGVMAAAKHHTFQVLTKRADRMARLLAAPPDLVEHTCQWLDRIGFERGCGSAFDVELPLPNVWLGVSVEDQKRADERIPLLLQAPAAVRFLSVEPLLEAVDLGMPSSTCDCCSPPWTSRWVKLRRPVFQDFPEYADKPRIAKPGIFRARSNPHGALSVDTGNGYLGIKPKEFECLPGIDWVIVGGESGPGARPFDVAWARSIVDQCKVAGVPAFVKQLGQRPFDSREAGRDSDDQRPGGAAADPDCRLQLTSRKGGDMAEWPDDVRVREFPRVEAATS